MFLFFPLENFLLTFFRVLLLIIIFYFLACILFLINRYHRIPHLKTVLHVMLIGAKGFPGILAHRIKLAPTRIKETLHHRGRKHVSHPAYPKSHVSVSKNKRRKRN